jgi:predicted methyltransferase
MATPVEESDVSLDPREAQEPSAQMTDNRHPPTVHDPPRTSVGCRIYCKREVV